MNNTLSLGDSATFSRRQHAKRAMVPVGKAASAALGSTARFATKVQKAASTQSFVEGLEAQLRAIGPDAPRDVQRRSRYRLQDVAQAVMAVFTLKKTDKEGVEKSYTRYKVCMCGRSSFNGQMQVDLTARGAVYRSMKCASVWHCPVCSAVISTFRCAQLHQAVQNAEALGYMPLLVTYTARHDAQTDLLAQYEAMTRAHRRVWSGGDIKAIKMRFGVLGIIRNLEVTVSLLNGWHTHIHSIVFVKRPEGREAARQVVADFDAVFRSRWLSALAEQGFNGNDHAYDVTNSSERVAQYFDAFKKETKWGPAQEMTQWNKKVGKQWQLAEHLTPWQLLEYAALGNEQAAELFRQYAVVFHGKKQLHWSKGLKEALGIEDKQDEEIVEEAQENAPLLFSVIVPLRTFREKVAKPRVRAHFLELIELADLEQIQQISHYWFGFIPQIVESNKLSC